MFSTSAFAHPRQSIVPPHAVPPFPRLRAYLMHLPQGLASYPEAQIKASLYVHSLNDKPLADFLGILPPEVATLVERPLLMSTWAPSVHVQALYLAIADAYELRDEAFQIWALRMQRSLLSSPLYRALAALASPTLLLSGAEKRWGSFHRDSEIEAQSDGPGRAVVRLRFPPHLYAPTNLAGVAGGIAAVAELSRARGCAVQVALRGSTEATFRVRWSGLRGQPPVVYLRVTPVGQQGQVPPGVVLAPATCSSSSSQRG